MPGPIGKRRIWDPASGRIVDEFGNLFPSPGQEPPTPDQPPIPTDPRGFVKSLLSSGLQIAGGLVPGGIPLRTAIAATTGGVGAAIEGEDIGGGMARNAALEGGFGAAANILPAAGTKLAIFSGGVGKIPAEARKDAAKAFASQRDRLFGGSRDSLLMGKHPTFRDGLFHPERTFEGMKERGVVDSLRGVPAVGNSSRSGALLDKVGKRLEEIESSTPGQIDWGPVVNKSLDPLLDAAKKAEVPPEYIQKVVDNESRYLVGQQAVRGPKFTESVRETMEMGRQEANRGKDVFNAQRGGQWVPQDDILHARINAARGKGLKDAAIAEADKTTFPGHSRSQGQRIKDANSEFSDLAEINSASEAMRSGTLFAGGRAGMGYGLGMALERLLGASGASSILGLLFTGATPGMISRLGTYGGRVAEVGPTIARANELTKKVRRRKPKSDEED